MTKTSNDFKSLESLFFKLLVKTLDDGIKVVYLKIEQKFGSDGQDHGIKIINPRIGIME